MFGVALTVLLVAQTLDVSGPLAFDSALDESLALPSGARVADLYWPTNATRASPLVVVGHGFARSKTAMTNWGAHLASYGFVVIVPNFSTPLSPDHQANALVMRELLAFVRATPGPITATIDATKDALIGHSAGGLSTFLAMAADPSIEVAVGLDPVDANALGAGVAATIVQPILVLGAESSQCNGSGSASTLYPLLSSGGSWFLRVVGSTHCDGEDPSGRACTAICGGEDAARRALYRRYATAHLLGWLHCEGLNYLPSGVELGNDLSSGALADFAEIPGQPCGSSPSDGGQNMDAAPETDSGLQADGRRGF